MSAPKTIPLYQRYRPTGVRQFNRAGVQASIKQGDDPNGDSVTWNVVASTLAGLVPQVETDYLRDAAGRWFVVTEVGPLSDGIYPLKCDRWKEGDPS